MLSSLSWTKDVCAQQYSLHAKQQLLGHKLLNCTWTMSTNGLDYQGKSFLIEICGSPHNLERPSPKN